MRDIWAPLLLFVFVIGGLYGRLLHADRSRRRRRGGAFLIGVARGRLRRKEILASLLQATRTAAAVFTVLIGALLFGYFLTVTQTPQKVTAFLTGLGLGRYGVLALIMLMYLVLGCLMDAMAMIILTIPIIFPVIVHLGFDPIWFGVIIVMTVELGLIHPPVGMNVFVIKSVVHDVSFSTIFKGVLPFIATDIIRLIILIAFPISRSLAAVKNVSCSPPGGHHGQPFSLLPAALRGCRSPVAPATSARSTRAAAAARRSPSREMPASPTRLAPSRLCTSNSSNRRA